MKNLYEFLINNHVKPESKTLEGFEDVKPGSYLYISVLSQGQYPIEGYVKTFDTGPFVMQSKDYHYTGLCCELLANHTYLMDKGIYKVMRYVDNDKPNWLNINTVEIKELRYANEEETELIQQAYEYSEKHLKQLNRKHDWTINMNTKTFTTK